MGLRLDLYPPPEVDGAPPVHLTPVDRLCVTFVGDRCRSGPLTIGQGTMYQWIVDERPYDEMISAPLPLPAGTMLADLVAVLGILITEHETLRTTFRFDGTPTQHVADSGELWVEVYRDDGTATTDAALAEELFRRLRATEFDPATDLPVRVAVVADGNVARVAAMVYHHLAVDLTGVALLSRRIATMLADPGRRRVEPHRHQPLDQADAEHSPRGRRRAETTARYWTDVLMSMPQCNFPLPRSDQAKPGRPLAGWLWSRAAATALPHIVSRTSVNGPIAVLAALGAVLAARTGQPHCVLQALSNNRFETRLRDYVGVLASDGLVSLEVTTPGFDELVRRAGTAVLKAGLCSPIDRLEKIRLLDAARHLRGTSYGRYCTFNYPGAAYEADMPANRELGDPAAAASAMSETSIVWLDWPHASEMLGFRLLQKDEGLHFGAIARDRRQIPPAEVELLLRGVERLLVAAATGDVPLNRVAEVTGVEPMFRGPQWRLVDRCLVELPEARRLLQDAVRSPLARVFAVPSERDGLRLEAYLPSGLVPGPREAHDACVALLPGRGTAMAPHRYVICDGAPADLDDLTAWRDRPVLTAGEGR